LWSNGYAYRAFSRPNRIRGVRTIGDANITGYDSAFGAVARRTVGSTLDTARVTRDTRVLDVCCGPGMLAAGALQRGAEVVGLDFSTEAVELALRLVPNGRFQRGDAQALPFTAASFDAVLCGYARGQHEGRSPLADGVWG
jgi:ubiquinone/menaquinone biosynthesis C-methylase UbiE